MLGGGILSLSHGHAIPTCGAMIYADASLAGSSAAIASRIQPQARRLASPSASKMASSLNTRYSPSVRETARDGIMQRQVFVRVEVVKLGDERRRALPLGLRRFQLRQERQPFAV